MPLRFHRIRAAVEQIAGSALTLSKLSVAASGLGDLVKRVTVAPDSEPRRAVRCSRLKGDFHGAQRR